MGSRGLITLTTSVRLVVGSRYRVDGVMHDYLGPALSPGDGGRVHAFRRREWRPDTPDQLLITLVPDASVALSVTRFGEGTNRTTASSLPSASSPG